MTSNHQQANIKVLRGLVPQVHQSKNAEKWRIMMIRNIFVKLLDPIFPSPKKFKQSHIKELNPREKMITMYRGNIFYFLSHFFNESS